MHPEIFQLGPLHVRSYGLMMAVAFLLATWLAVRIGRRRGIDPDTILNLGLVVLVSGVAGARLLYVLGHPHEFAGRWHETLYLWQGGLTLWGGFLVAIPAGIFYCARKRLPTWEIADVVAIPVALGVSVGRVGCYLNGCCYGTPTTLPWGVRFPEGSVPYAQFGDQAIHPSQLYNVIAGLAVAGAVWVVGPRLKAPGQRFWLMVGLYAVARSLVDWTRYYEPSAYYWRWGESGITESQVVGGLLVLLSVAMFFLLDWRARSLTAAASAGPPATPPAGPEAPTRDAGGAVETAGAG